MREQKFRFIFKNGNFFAKRYMTLDELLDSNFALEQMEESINSESNIYDLEDYPDYEVFKDEYTGFAIKNKEIYKGDIIKGRKDTIYRVVFGRGCFFLYHVNLFDADKNSLRWGLLSRLFDSDMIDIEKACEIIGNIHEKEIK